MYEKPLFYILALMTLATTITYIVGMKEKKKYIMKFKYSIWNAIIYNLVLLTDVLVEHHFIDLILDNALPVIGLFLWRNLYIEFHRSINREERNAPLSLFIRVMPYIYAFLLSLSILQLLMNRDMTLNVIGAFHYIVVIGVLLHQVVVLTGLFLLNNKLKDASSEKYMHVFLNNNLAIVVYMIILIIDSALGISREHIIVSGMIYNVVVGFFFVNYISEDFLYEAKLYQKKVITLAVPEQAPKDSGAYDGLTKVYTREYFIRHIKTFDKDDESMSVVVIQLTGLRLINGSFGYEYGDEIIQEMTMIITDIFLNSTVARTSGSQFAVMQVGMSEDDIRERIRAIATLCSKRDGFAVDIHFGYQLRGDSSLLLYDIFRRAEEDLYAKRVISNKKRQHEITEMLYTNFGMLMPMLSSHLKRSADLCESFVRFMGMNENFVYDVRHGALLHDIALTIMPNIVDYYVDFKDEFEQRQYKSHVSKGYEIAVESGINPTVAEGILYHHEHYDGSGYPDGLIGDQIPLIAQIIGICDMVDRVVHFALKSDELENMLQGTRGKEYSDDMVDQMLAYLKVKGVIE